MNPDRNPDIARDNILAVPGGRDGRDRKEQKR